MDEEDLREIEESKNLTTTQDFDGFGSTEQDNVRRSALMDLVRPSGETIGVRLLQRMGWKNGHGIGPKVKRKAEGDETGDLHAFAPRDPQLISFVRKMDHKGLGYEGEARFTKSKDGFGLGPSNGARESSDDENDLNLSIRPKKSVDRPRHEPKRGGFGVGVLNDLGSDDDDPYSMGPKISYNRTIGGEKKSKKQTSSNSAMSNPLLRSKPIFVSKKKTAKSDLRKCHDGRLPLPGFRLATEPDALAALSLSDDQFKPPQVPASWVSSKNRTTKESSTTKYLSTAEAAKASILDSKSRATLLGEAPLPGKSVFDFITPGARNRLVTASGRSDLPDGRGEKAPEGYELTDQERQKSLSDLVPQLEPQIASQALNRGVDGWTPYADDESKRSRYRKYLEIRAGIREGLPERTPVMTLDDWKSEMNEFARSAQVFRPVTGLMASRFTSSSSQPTSSSDSAAAAGSLVNRPVSKPTDPAVEAARLGMFGPMTRSVQDFYPTRLLCKRFNVPPPNNLSNDQSETGSTQTYSTETRFSSGGFQHSDEEDPAPTGSLTQAMLTSRANDNVEVTTAASKPVDIDPDRNEAIEGERAGAAVFRAIFGSDDEDEN